MSQFDLESRSFFEIDVRKLTRLVSSTIGTQVCVECDANCAVLFAVAAAGGTGNLAGAFVVRQKILLSLMGFTALI